MANKEVAAAAVADSRLDELMEQESRRPPDLEPVGQCPSCHHGLQKQEVRQERDMHLVLIGGAAPPIILLTFWGCTNEACSLMFWRHPKKLTSVRPPWGHEDIEN